MQTHLTLVALSLWLIVLLALTNVRRIDAGLHVEGERLRLMECSPRFANRQLGEVRQTGVHPNRFQMTICQEVSCPCCDDYR